MRTPSLLCCKELDTTLTNTSPSIASESSPTLTKITTNHVSAICVDVTYSVTRLALVSICETKFQSVSDISQKNKQQTTELVFILRCFINKYCKTLKTSPWASFLLILAPFHVFFFSRNGLLLETTFAKYTLGFRDQFENSKGGGCGLLLGD